MSWEKAAKAPVTVRLKGYTKAGVETMQRIIGNKKYWVLALGGLAVGLLALMAYKHYAPA
jgi:hypothetical protein